MPNQSNVQHEQAIERAHQACLSPIWIQDEQALTSAVEQWKQCSLLAIDTEFIRERTYYPQLALVQVSDGDQVWLIDSPKLNQHQGLSIILADPHVVKVLHSPREDLEVLSLASGESPSPLFDTQAAAALCGDSLQSSYGALLASTLDIHLDKELARSDWLQRPLSPEQIKYACCDVAYLPLMAKQLEQRLQDLQRTAWLAEDMALLLKECLVSTPDSELYLSLPGAGRLDSSELKILHRLCRWREQVAREQNLPRQFVLRNESMLQLAIHPPTKTEDLYQHQAIRSSQVRRYGSQVVAQVQQAIQDPSVAAVPMLSPEQQQRIKKAQKIVRQYAEEWSLEAAVLASRRELERWMKDGPEQIPPRLQTWRWPLFGETLQNVLWP